MASPRRKLLDAIGVGLQKITKAGGYLTDIGTAWTTEPTPGDDDTPCVLTALIEKQAVGATPAAVQTHRLTVVSVLAKVQSSSEQYQQHLDDMVTDIETVMADKQATNRNYPPGYQFPAYVGMEPLMPERAGAGWVGVLITYQTHIPIK